jgi:hypothetical protein
MVKTEKLQINIIKMSAENVSFEIVKDNKKSKHKATIVDNHGIFGVEFPKEISLILSYYPAETKEFIGTLREMYFSFNKLQAA